MPWLRPKLIVLLTLCCLITVNAQATTKDVFKSGVWSGLAHYSNKSGEFSRCSMKASYKSGTDLSFTINLDGLSEMFLYNPAWKLDEGDKYDITYQVDSKPKQAGKAHVIDKQGIIIYVQRSRTFLLHVKRGYRLHLTTPVKTFTYGLNGTFDAVKKLSNCFYDHVGDSDQTADKTNPFARGKKDNPPATNPFEKRTDDGATRKKRSKNPVSKAARDTTVEFVRLVLALLPDAKAELTIPDKTPEFLKSLNPDLTWYYGGAVGVAHALPFYPSEKTALRILKASDKETCAGNFFSASEVRSFANTKYGDVVVIRNACDKDNDTGTPLFAVYTFYRQKTGTPAIRISHVSAEPGSAKEADKKFFQVIDRVLDKKNKQL